MKCNHAKISILTLILMAFLSLQMMGCHNESRSDDKDDYSGPQAHSLSLSISQVSVQSDNSDTCSITATVLDENNAAIEDVPVSFSTTSGQLSAPMVTTDTNGQSEVLFSSGTADHSNRTCTIAPQNRTLEFADTECPLLSFGPNHGILF